MSKKIFVVGTPLIGKSCLTAGLIAKELELLKPKPTKEISLEIKNIYQDIEVYNPVFISKPKRKRNRKPKRRNHYE